MLFRQNTRSLYCLTNQQWAKPVGQVVVVGGGDTHDTVGSETGRKTITSSFQGFCIESHV